MRNSLDIDAGDADALIKYLKDSWFGQGCKWRDFVTMQRLLQVGLDTFAGKLLDTNNSCERKHLTLMEGVFSRRVFRDPAKMFRALLLGASEMAAMDIQEQLDGTRQHGAVRRLPLLAWRLLLRALTAARTPGAGPKEPAAARHKGRYFFAPQQDANGPDEAGCGVADSTNAGVGTDEAGGNTATDASDSGSDGGSDSDGEMEGDAGALRRIAEYEERAACVGQAAADAPAVPPGYHLVDTKLMSCSCAFNAVWGRTPAVSGRLGCAHLLHVLLHNPGGVLVAKSQAQLKQASIALDEGYTTLLQQADVPQTTKWHDEGPATAKGCKCAQRAFCPLPIDFFMWQYANHSYCLRPRAAPQKAVGSM